MDYQIPTPKFQIGQRVRWLRDESRDYNEQRYLRWLISESRGAVGGPGRFSTHVKTMIREAAAVVHAANEAEIVGIVPWSLYNKDSAMYNQCYLREGGTHSGIQFTYQLCIRFETMSLRTCALFTGIPVAWERDLEAI